jgi:hypothetical protein
VERTHWLVAAAVPLRLIALFFSLFRDRLVDRLWPHSIRITHCDFSIVELVGASANWLGRIDDRQEFEK